MKHDSIRRSLLSNAARAATTGRGPSAFIGNTEPPYIPGSGVVPVGYRWATAGARDARAMLRTLPTDRAASRLLARTSPIAAGAVQTNVDRVVGTGLALVSMPNAKVLGWSDAQVLDFKENVQTEFSIWSDSAECDWSGAQNFYEKQGLVERASLESGDCFTLLPDAARRSPSQPYQLRIQTIEADRVGNPAGLADGGDSAAGVRFTDGAATAYYLYNPRPGAVLQGEWIERVGASGRRRMLHHFRQNRPEQVRGTPYLNVIAGLLDQLAEYTEAEIVSAIAASKITGVITTPDGQPQAPIWGAAAGADAAAIAAAESAPIEMGAGRIIALATGEKFELADAGRDNNSFDPFVLSILTQIGMALGIPRELLCKAFNASYSASKAALLDAWMRFRAERVWLARSFCQPVYETWFIEAVISGRISAPGFFRDPRRRWAYTQAAWHGDSMGSINPKDEVAAYRSAIDGGLMTHERATWELWGEDWNGLVKVMGREQRALEENGIQIVPSAGAPAPAKPAGPSSGDQAIAAMAAAQTSSAEAMIAMLARPQTAPHVEVNVAAPVVNVEPAQVEVRGGDVHLPEMQVQLDAHIAQPAITVQAPAVQVDVAPAQVHVSNIQQPTTQTIERDADGEIARITTVPISPTLN